MRDELKDEHMGAFSCELEAKRPGEPLGEPLDSRPHPQPQPRPRRPGPRAPGGDRSARKLCRVTWQQEQEGRPPSSAVMPRPEAVGEDQRRRRQTSVGANTRPGLRTSTRPGSWTGARASSRASSGTGTPTNSSRALDRAFHEFWTVPRSSPRTNPQTSARATPWTRTRQSVRKSPGARSRASHAQRSWAGPWLSHEASFWTSF